MMEALFRMLESGNDVRITYETVNSKRLEVIEATLNGVAFKQNPKSDTIVVRDLNTNTFQDIRVSTIKDWILTDLENAK
tara:strand:- start:203 stop:439 length:237 start_codon:yes stop_codon:yes gene_type:complete